MAASNIRETISVFILLILFCFAVHGVCEKSKSLSNYNRALGLGADQQSQENLTPSPTPSSSLSLEIPSDLDGVSDSRQGEKERSSISQIPSYVRLMVEKDNKAREALATSEFTAIEESSSPSSSSSSSSSNEAEDETESSSRKKFLSWSVKKRYKKLPIRPPKLKATLKPIVRTSSKFSYASSVKIRKVDTDNEKVEARNKTSKKQTKMAFTKDVDELELSSSERKSTLTLHQKLKPIQLTKPRKAVKEEETNSTINLPYGTRTIPKLLLPKAHRPAMYSLDGFIPKPNSQRITTTTTPAPTTNRFRKIKLKTKPSEKPEIVSRRKKYGSKRYQESADVNDLNTSGTVNRGTFSKRKGSLSASQFLHPTPPRNRVTVVGRKGVPGQDYPTLAAIPKTSFNCTKKSLAGIFADIETDCQVWHMCQGGRQHSFLCPNGTIFSERSGVCDWWYNTECPKRVDTIALKVDFSDDAKSSRKRKASRG